MCIKRGDIIVVNLSGEKGCEQGGINRSCVVISNDLANKHSPVISVAPLTTKMSKRPLPTHVLLTTEQYPLKADSIILCEQVRTIDKTRIIGTPLFRLNQLEMVRVNKAMMIQLGLNNIAM